MNTSDFWISEALIPGELCKEMLAESRELEVRAGSVGADNEVRPNLRKTEVQWLDQYAKAWWMSYAIGLQANQEAGWNLQVGGAEFTQLGTYEVGGFYDWHVDGGFGPASIRKLSVVVQLTSPDEYDGGELVILSDGNNQKVVPRAQGTVAVFPSVTPHTVKPVTRGVRRTATTWLTGHPFK
jgi:PKHD-type hydroxylase